MSTVNYPLQKDSCKNENLSSIGKKQNNCLANDGFRADQRTVDLAFKTDDYASSPREENGRPTKVADLDSEIRKHPIPETNDRLNTKPISFYFIRLML